MTKFKRFDMIGDVIEVNCRARLLQEIDAFHTNLVILLKLFLALVLEHEDAVLLIWLVLLCQNDLLKTHWFANLHFCLSLDLNRGKFLHLE